MILKIVDDIFGGFVHFWPKVWGCRLMRHSSHLILLKIAQMDDKFPFYADENSDPCPQRSLRWLSNVQWGPLNQTIKIEKLSIEVVFLIQTIFITTLSIFRMMLIRREAFCKFASWQMLELTLMVTTPFSNYHPDVDICHMVILYIALILRRAVWQSVRETFATPPICGSIYNLGC